LAQAGRHRRCPVCGGSLWFRLQEFDNTVMINVLPTLDLEYSDIALVVESLARNRPGVHVIVNLSLVSYIGSTFLDRLIISKKRLAAVNGRLILCGFNDAIHEVFRITRLDGFFEITDDDQVAKRVADGDSGNDRLE
jgi:anti-anti-sigma factor